MNVIKPITNWLEIRACVPTYTGWVLAGISTCFFGAAINTMAGWLYVISGISFALLGIAAVLPMRELVGLSVIRRPIEPVTAGDVLKVELEIHNSRSSVVSLIQVADILPYILGKPIQQAIESIPIGGCYRWVYYYPTERRGVYRWQTVELSSGAPFGLFWSRRPREVTARAVVYPTVLPLASCPLVDEMGQEDSLRGDPRGRPFQTATVGLTRSLRPYRIGDPIRLIHWRSSARYGELRLRELELITGGQDIIIALDSAGKWGEEEFEQAVITAASLYFYAHRQQMQVQLWTAATDLVRGEKSVLETLAATLPAEDIINSQPKYPLIWLTQNSLTISALPSGSRWVLWDVSSVKAPVTNPEYSGIILNNKQPLKAQLQEPLSG
jgi:uncharacterized protein (DUF58 family)